MSSKKRRGRPESSESKKRKQLESDLKALPAYRKLTEKELTALNCQLEAADRAAEQIQKAFKIDATTPSSHAYDMASLGDESLIGYEAAVLAQDELYQRAAANRRKSGSDATKALAADRGRQVCDVNRALIAQIKPNGKRSIHSVASRIRDEWDSLLPSGPMSIEPATLKSRGIGGDPPSVQTLSRWIRKQLESNR